MSKPFFDPRPVFADATLLDAAERPERRVIRFLFFPTLRAWASADPVGAAERVEDGQWFARWLLVPAVDIRSEPLWRTLVYGEEHRIEHWADAMDPTRLAQRDIDAGAPDARRVLARLIAVGYDPLRLPGRDRPENPLARRERDLRARLIEHDSALAPEIDNGSPSTLWDLALKLGVCDRAEHASAERAYARGGRDWRYAGD